MNTDPLFLPQSGNLRVSPASDVFVGMQASVSGERNESLPGVDALLRGIRTRTGEIPVERVRPRTKTLGGVAPMAESPCSKVGEEVVGAVLASSRLELTMPSDPQERSDHRERARRGATAVAALGVIFTACLVFGALSVWQRPSDASSRPGPSRVATDVASNAAVRVEVPPSSAPLPAATAPSVVNGSPGISESESSTSDAMRSALEELRAEAAAQVAQQANSVPRKTARDVNAGVVSTPSSDPSSHTEQGTNAPPRSDLSRSQ